MAWRCFLPLLFGAAVLAAAWQPSESKVDKAPQYIALFSVEVEPGHESVFVERFQKRARFVDKAKGFCGLFVLQHQRDANKFVVMTLWQDEANFRAWVNSEEFRKGHGQGNLPVRQMQLDGYKVVLSAPKPDNAAQ